MFLPSWQPAAAERRLGEIPKQVTRRKTIKRTFFNVLTNLAHFTDNFKMEFDVKFVDI